MQDVRMPGAWLESRMPKVFDSFSLKVLAMAAMTADHAAVAFLKRGMLPGILEPVLTDTALYRWYILLWIVRGFGRMAFPIFMFLLVEGFFHTGSQRKHALRLLLFAVLSEAPFDLATHGTLFYWEHQNVMLTLLLSFLAMCLAERLRGVRAHAFLLRILVFAGMAGASCLLKADYGWRGVLLCAVFYFLRKNRLLSCAFGTAALSSEPASILAFPFLYLYNGRKGRNTGRFFYFFYPLHLLILYLLTVIL